MLRSSLFALAAVLAGGMISWSAPPEPVYSIKLKKPEQGDVAIVLFKFEYASKAKGAPAGPPKIEVPKDVKEAPPIPIPPPPAPQPAVPPGDVKGHGTLKPLPRGTIGTRGGMVFLFEETLLEVDPKKGPTRRQRSYEQAVVKSEGHETKLPYEWQTLVIEKKDDKLRYVKEGGKELTGDDARDLDEELAKAPSPWESHELLLPGKSVRLNDPWTVSVEPFVKYVNNGSMAVDGNKSTAKGKLLRVYEKDGHRFGVLEVRVELAAAEAEGAPWLTADITLDACIDGTSTDFVRTIKTQFVTQGKTGERTVTCESEAFRKEIRKK